MGFVVGISGGSGSGKTSFVKAIEQAFDASAITVLSQDDYYKPIEKQKKDKQGVHNFDLPKAIYLKQFAKDIKALKAGQVIERQEYTFNNSEATPKTLIFKPAPILLVEGLFVFHEKKISEQLDLSVLINAKISDKIIRRILRDQTERNYPLDDVLYRYKHHVMPAYNKYILPYINEVDLVINNNLSFQKGKEVLEAYLRLKLQ